MTTSIDYTSNNPAVAINAALCYLADNNAGVHWGDDFNRRRADFFSALASWNQSDSTYEAALKAAFSGVDVMHVQFAELRFYEVLHAGTSNSHPQFAHKPSIKQRISGARDMIVGALKS
jgi:hypothetical protein